MTKLLGDVSGDVNEIKLIFLIFFNLMIKEEYIFWK